MSDLFAYTNLWRETFASEAIADVNGVYLPCWDVDSFYSWGVEAGIVTTEEASAMYKASFSLAENVPWDDAARNAVLAAVTAVA